jgi:hypothetical protein
MFFSVTALPALAEEAHWRSDFALGTPFSREFYGEGSLLVPLQNINRWGETYQLWYATIQETFCKIDFLSLLL